MASIWDVTLEDTNEATNDYPLLPDGTYEFQVEKVTGKEYTPKPGGKMGRCAEIDLQMRVDTADREYKVFDRLYTDPSAIWKMTAFAKSIGEFKTGMTPSALLRAAEGAIGNFEVRTHEYNGKKSNEVKRYIAKPTIGNEDLPF